MFKISKALIRIRNKSLLICNCFISTHTIHRAVVKVTGTMTPERPKGSKSAVWQIGPHCKENPIYVFIFWELRGLSPNFHIHVSVSDLYVLKISPHISLQQNWQTDPINI
jgi:hypothetical protein